MSRALTRDGAATREGKDGIGALVKPECILSGWGAVLPWQRDVEKPASVECGKETVGRVSAA